MDLGSLLGGLAGEESQGSNAAQGDDVLGSLSDSAGGGDLGSLLGAFMGGGGGQGAQGSDAMMGMLGGLLGGMGGGQGTQGGGDMMSMLGGLLGGMGGASPNAGGMDTGMNAALAPLADMLSQKLGLPREMAMAAMAVVVPMILSKLSGGGAQGGDRSAGLSFSPTEQDEMIQSLASQTGLSPEQSAQVLNQAVQVLGSE